MEVKHLSKEHKYDLVVDYDELLGKKWANCIKNTLTSKQMNELMYNLHEKYKSCNFFYPSKHDIFNAFKYVGPSEIKVVIVDTLPKFSEHSNGLALGTKYTDKEDVPRDILDLFKQINTKYHSNITISNDYTLKAWANQGVLLLNSALTGTQMSRDISEWYFFVQNVIKYINDFKTGVVFLFLEDANFYSSMVNKKRHTVIKSKSLTIDKLDEINNEILFMNGEGFNIEW
jgi:uracil-DNA glycosylase